MPTPPTTNNHNLPLIPHIGDTNADDYTDQWGAILNDDGWSVLETKLTVTDTEANRTQYTPHQNALFYATDTGAIYKGDGTNWNQQPGKFTTISTSGDLSVGGNISASNDSITVAGNNVSLGESTSIAHGDLDSSTINSGDHHTKTTSASELTDVSADSVSGAHHTKYTDPEAVSAVNATDSLSVNISGDADTVDGYQASDLSALDENETVTGEWTFTDSPIVKNENSYKYTPSFTYNQGSDNTTYYHEIGFVTDQNGAVHVHGFAGGHTPSEGKAALDFIMSNRDQTIDVSHYAGDLGTAADFEVYEDGNGDLHLYLVTSSWAQVNLELRDVGAGDIYPNASPSSTQPSYTKVYTLSTDAQLQVDYDGHLLTNGSRVATRTWTTNNFNNYTDTNAVSAVEAASGLNLSGGITLSGDLSNGTTTIWDNSAGSIPTSSLGSNNITVAGNSVSLGGSTSIAHGDLDSATINSGDHHTKTTSASDLTDVSPDSTSNAHHAKTTSASELTDVSADSASSAHHSKTSSASELTDVSADSVSGAHHTKYTNSDAVSAVEAASGLSLSGGIAVSGNISSGTTTIWNNSGGYVEQTSLENDSVSVAGNTVSLGSSTTISHGDLTNVTSGDHHTYPVPNTGLVNSSVSVAGKSLSLGGSITIGHGDLDSTTVNSGDHHTYPVPNTGLVNSSVTVAGNSVSLGNSTTISHGDLNNVTAGDHHTAHEHPGDKKATSDINVNSNNITGVSEISGSYAIHTFGGSTYNIDLQDSSADARYRNTANNTIIWFRENKNVQVPNGQLSEQGNRVATRTWVNGEVTSGATSLSGLDTAVSNLQSNKLDSSSYTPETDTHSKTTSASGLTDVSADSVSNAHHSKTTSASGLTDVSADSNSSAHHSKYTDSNARSAVNGSNTSITGSSGSVSTSNFEIVENSSTNSLDFNYTGS